MAQIIISKAEFNSSKHSKNIIFTLFPYKAENQQEFEYIIRDEISPATEA